MITVFNFDDKNPLRVFNFSKPNKYKLVEYSIKSVEIIKFFKDYIKSDAKKLNKDALLYLRLFIQ